MTKSQGTSTISTYKPNSMFAEVALLKNTIDAGTFTYKVPAALEKILSPGQQVLVPYRKDLQTGIVMSTTEYSPLSKVRDIEKILHIPPLLTHKEIHIIHYIAHHYYAPINKCARLYLPEGIWDDTFTPRFQISLQVINQSYIPKTQAKAEQALLKLLREDPDNPMPVEGVKAHGISSATVKKLIEKNVISKIEGELEATLEEPPIQLPLPPLSTTQKHCLDKVLQNPKGTYLLHGITGSGKTHVYFHIAHHFAKQGKQTVLLVPEISLTPQMIQKLHRFFGSSIALLHSKRTPRERAQEWYRIRAGLATVIVGSRSALFCPVPKLGAIILDEEHEWSYKNDQNPRYHARTVAHELSNLHQCPLILGSATPSIETFYHSQQGKYTYLSLPEKFY